MFSCWIKIIFSFTIRVTPSVSYLDLKCFWTLFKKAGKLHLSVHLSLRLSVSLSVCALFLVNIIYMLQYLHMLLKFNKADFVLKIAYVFLVVCVQRYIKQSRCIAVCGWKYLKVYFSIFILYWTLLKYMPHSGKKCVYFIKNDINFNYLSCTGSHINFRKHSRL